MNSTPLPAELICPEFWPYTDEWIERYDLEHGRNFLSKVCKHSEASFYIMYYIGHRGEMALTKIKTQNSFIKRIAAGTVSPIGIVGDSDIDWQGGDTWERFGQWKEEVFEIYHASLAPAEIQDAIEKVGLLISVGVPHCQQLLQYIADFKAAARQNIVDELEAAAAARRSPTKRRDWAAVDVVHSKVETGFIYILSNALMPGVYKIGFTAGNPDKRARELSGQYGLPSPFEMVKYWRTKDPYIVEQRIHAELAKDFRAGEFFQVDLKHAIDIIEINVAGL